MHSWAYVVELTGEELETLEEGEPVSKSISDKNIVIKRNSCEDGHNWGKVKASNDKLHRRCEDCGAVESTRCGLGYAIDVLATDIEE